MTTTEPWTEAKALKLCEDVAGALGLRIEDDGEGQPVRWHLISDGRVSSDVGFGSLPALASELADMVEKVADRNIIRLLSDVYANFFDFPRVPENREHIQKQNTLILARQLRQPITEGVTPTYTDEIPQYRTPIQIKEVVDDHIRHICSELIDAAMRAHEERKHDRRY